MDADLLFVVGVASIGLAVPGLIFALIGGYVPRFASSLGGMGLALIALAITHRTFGYSVWEIPATFTRVYLRYTQGG